MATRSSMRVLMFSLDPKLADPQSAVRVRHQEYAAEMQELAIIVLAPSEKEETVYDGKLTLYFSGRKTRMKLWYWCTGIIWGIRRGGEVARRLLEKGAVVATSHEPFGVGLITYLVARPLNIPLQLQVHTDVFSPLFRQSFKNKLFAVLAWYLIPRAQGIRVVSKSSKQLLTTTYNLQPSSISVLPVYVDTDRFRMENPMFSLKQKYPQFEKIILVVSRLTSEKRVDLAIDVFADLHQKCPRAGLIILGEGPERKNLESRILNLESLRPTPYALRPYVIFVGWQNDLVPYYKGADALLVSSDYEGYGMQMVEALAAGCPVVATDVGVAREVGAQVGGTKAELTRLLAKTLESNQRGVLPSQFEISEEEYVTRLVASYKQCLHL